MSNSIALAQQYLNVLDEVYTKSITTMDLEIPTTDIRNTNNAQTIQIQSLALDGLSDYNRNTGYSSGSATLTWEDYVLSKDRAKRFNLDQMDSSEAMLGIAKLAGEFVRTQVVPEVDQYRFSKLYDGAYVTHVAQTTTPTSSTIFDDIMTGAMTVRDAQAGESQLILYISTNCYYLLKSSTDIVKNFSVQNGGMNVNTNIEMFDNMKIVTVPSTRFASGVTLGDGSFTQTGYKLNFVIVDPAAAFAIKKLDEIKIITPELNQTYSGWSYFYRLYHDMFVYDNKTKGIYVNYGTAV
jgi:hypothetical protein